MDIRYGNETAALGFKTMYKISSSLYSLTGQLICKMSNGLFQFFSGGLLLSAGGSSQKGWNDNRSTSFFSKMKKRDKYILLVSPCNKRADVWLGRELDLRKRQEEDDGGAREGVLPGFITFLPLCFSNRSNPPPLWTAMHTAVEWKWKWRTRALDSGFVPMPGPVYYMVVGDDFWDKEWGSEAYFTWELVFLCLQTLNENYVKTIT